MCWGQSGPIVELAMNSSLFPLCCRWSAWPSWHRSVFTTSTGWSSRSPGSWWCGTRTPWSPSASWSMPAPSGPTDTGWRRERRRTELPSLRTPARPFCWPWQPRKGCFDRCCVSRWVYSELRRVKYLKTNWLFLLLFLRDTAGLGSGENANPADGCNLPPGFILL